MKKSKIIASLFILFLIVGFINHDHPNELRKIPRLPYENPPGCVWLHDNLFIDQTEISNIEWLEFIMWTGRFEPEKLNSVLPDTTVWKDSAAYNDPYVLYYLRHPAYRNYPVVGISYEQAVAFCEWRSDRVNEFIYVREHPVKSKDYNPDSIYPHPEVMHFRLPTKTEWEYAASAGLNPDVYPLGYEDAIGEKNQPVYNTTEYGLAQQINFLPEYRINDASEITQPVTFGIPNRYGVYNMVGNVSEFISDSQFMGMNYMTAINDTYFTKHPENYLRINPSAEEKHFNQFSFQYQKPQAWLGFRCVCEVKKELGSGY